MSEPTTTATATSAANPVRSLAQRLRRLGGYWPVPVALAAGTAFWIGQQWGAGALDGSRSETARRIETFERAIATGRSQRKERPRVERGLDELAVRTLGSDLESADSALRSALNRLGEEAGLAAGMVVSTQGPSTRGTPAKNEFGRTGTQKTLRDQPDFVELPASISVQGPLDAVLRLAHRIEAEPWLKRIDSFRLDRTGGDDRMRLDLKLTTVFLPGRAMPQDLEVPASEAPAFDRYASLIAANPFAMPVTPEPEPRRPRRRETPPPPPPGPPAFPYGEWMITGLVEGPTGPEVWLRHRSSGESLALAPEARVGDAELLRIVRSVEGDRAEFRLGEESFAVLVGETLVDRYPLRQ